MITLPIACYYCGSTYCCEVIESPARRQFLCLDCERELFPRSETRPSLWDQFLRLIGMRQ